MKHILAEIKALVVEDLQAVNEVIKDNLSSSVPLIQEIGTYILKSGGKRLRPLLVLISSKANSCKGSDHQSLAAVIEFIHTATLLHDDVVDEATVRRNQPSANTKWSDEASVLVGDFLYSRAFQMMVQIGHMPILQVIANTTNIIAEGEVLQLLQRGNLHLTEEEYRRIIHHKTAALFAAATEIGALLTTSNPAICESWRHYGLSLGLAFQLIDDLLDYESREDTGKQPGKDFIEGKLTLPLIYLRETTEEHAALVTMALEDPNEETFASIQAAVLASGADVHIRQQARVLAEQAKHAIADIPDSTYKQAALSLADYIWCRHT